MSLFSRTYQLRQPLSIGMEVGCLLSWAAMADQNFSHDHYFAAHLTFDIGASRCSDRSVLFLSCSEYSDYSTQYLSLAASIALS